MLDVMLAVVLTLDWLHLHASYLALPIITGHHSRSQMV